eukprot:gene33245-42989_t
MIAQPRRIAASTLMKRVSSSVARNLLEQNSQIRIILMSATIHTALYKDYFNNSYSYYGDMEFQDQPKYRVFVKLVLATNAAESSITLPDVDCIRNTWISKASSTQRAGRTGRMRPGTVDLLEPPEMSNVDASFDYLFEAGMISFASDEGSAFQF